MSPVPSKLVVSIENMACDFCVRNIEENTRTLEGVKNVKVDLASQSGEFEFDETVTGVGEIVKKIESLGKFKATAKSLDGEELATATFEISGVHSDEFCEKLAAEVKGKKGIVFLLLVPGEKEVKVVYKSAVTNKRRIGQLLNEAVPSFVSKEN